MGAPCGGGAGAPPFVGPGLVAGHAWPVRWCRRVLGGLAWCRLVLGGAGRSLPPSIDVPRRDAAAAAVDCTGRVTVPGGVGPEGPLQRGRGGRGNTVQGTGGMVPGGRQCMRVERPVAAIPCAGAARARGVVARWGRLWAVVVVGGGAGGGGGGAVGGGGAGSCANGAAGMALGSLVDILVPPVGPGCWASCAVPGAVLLGG